MGGGDGGTTPECLELLAVAVTTFASGTPLLLEG